MKWAETRETPMGKFDGMDPELVRDLLSEIRQAAGQMRTIEGRITRLMGEAGLSSQSTHRPVQIAEACDVMVKDVSARVALLEKRIEQGTAPGSGTPDAASPAPGAETPARDTGKPETPRAEDLKPAVPGSGESPRVEDQSADDPPKPESGSKPEADSTPDPKPEADSKGDERSPRDGGGAQGDDRSGGSETKPDPKPEADSTPDPKPEADSKGDERSPRDGGGTQGDDPLDTPEKDHPDDIDQTGELRPQIVEVDGVKVLQIPLDPPTAEEVEALLEDIENIPPMDMPTMDGTGTDAGGQPGTGTDGGGQPGTGAGGTAPGGSGTPGDTVARWADDGSDVVSAEAGPLNLDALRTLVDNVREIEPLEMPGVQVPEGETWGEGAWVPMDVGPDGPAGEVDPADPLRPIPPPGGSSGASSGPQSA
ncbi:hypothetical protein Pve01_50540 [Planomonospora venezuelensis]|nr:hypothetical protein Pve01_50540 [Planomonospora venezuelensis]